MSPYREQNITWINYGEIQFDFFFLLLLLFVICEKLVWVFIVGKVVSFPPYLYKINGIIKKKHVKLYF